jgi:hypothetical protein
MPNVVGMVEINVPETPEDQAEMIEGLKGMLELGADVQVCGCGNHLIALEPEGGFSDDADVEVVDIEIFE